MIVFFFARVLVSCICFLLTECDAAPLDTLVDIVDLGDYTFGLPEIEYETFELHFRLKANNCSILVLSDVDYLGSNYYEIGKML